MKTEQARELVRETFQKSFDEGRFRNFIINLLNHIDESTKLRVSTNSIKDAFKVHVERYERLGTYTTPDKELVDVLMVYLTSESKLERARTAIRNFVADHLKSRDNMDTALVAFISPAEKQWRFSYVKLDYSTIVNDNKISIQTNLTPARRSSYIVGENESCHTAQSRFLNLLQDTENHPSLKQLEEAFSVEAVTKEFFEQYKSLFLDLKDELDSIAKKDKKIGKEFKEKNIETADFAKKLMGQIVFLYFLQKKGWLGVGKSDNWGDGAHDFLRKLFKGDFRTYKNFFNEILEPLFYETLATDRGHSAICKFFNCRIPFLNGGLFEPLAGYDWENTDIIIPNKLFSNTIKSKGEDIGTGILDVFDRYNFTVNEDEPLEKEVAIDPEMLGKVFENLLEVKERKSKGSFYTPREIVHYMCQESLINYLDTVVNDDKETISRDDIETLIHSGDQASHYELARLDGTGYKRNLPKSIEKYAKLLDEKLTNITVCDPAIGSGAFPVGMMHEIISARSALTPYFDDVQDRSAYIFKRHAIQNCIYGVDIDDGAVEIAKLRLWLSLVVDEENVKQINPLPNLDYKIVKGNSLLGLPFHTKQLGEFEQLKKNFFNETSLSKKNTLKIKIGKLLNDLFKNSEKSFGYKIDFDFKVMFSEIFQTKGGFDIVIGNPPYGADIIPLELKAIKKQVVDTGNSNSAALFIDFGKNIFTHKTGTLSFIVPKSILYSEDWFSLVKAMLKETTKLVDVEKAFDKVLLEQVVFVLQKQTEFETYMARKFIDTTFSKETIIPKNCVSIFESWVCDVSEIELQLGGRIREHSETLSTFVDCFRGFPIQKIIKDNGYYPVIGGINLTRFGVRGVKGYLTKDDYNKLGKKIDKIAQPKLMAQNLVAHIKYPKPHIKIIVGIDENGQMMNLDTITNIVLKSDAYSLEFILAILNSTLISWYAYKFIFCSAIRTMHFDRSYVGKIPIPTVSREKQASVEKLVRKILSLESHQDESISKLEKEIDKFIYELYGMTNSDINIVEIV